MLTSFLLVIALASQDTAGNIELYFNTQQACQAAMSDLKVDNRFVILSECVEVPKR